ncbi:MAG: hypothetical protein U0V18_09515 [Anaerolineales bacterium]
MKSYRFLFGFMALLVAVSLACGGSGTPTTNPTLPPVPTNPPAQQPQDQGQQPQDQGQVPSDGTILTYTDQNNLWAFDLPADWQHEYKDLGDTLYTDATAYLDTFTSPDGSAYIDSLVMFANEGVTVNNSTSQAVALDLLNTYYSSTGKNNGDIRIKSDQIMQDGSERFEWVSKGGNYFGTTFFEVRGSDKRTWLMWTLVADNNADQAVLDILDNAIASYRIP